MVFFSFCFRKFIFLVASLEEFICKEFGFLVEFCLVVASTGVSQDFYHDESLERCCWVACFSVEILKCVRLFGMCAHVKYLLLVVSSSSVYAWAFENLDVEKCKRLL